MIPRSKPFFDNNELDGVKKTLNSGWVAGQGPQGTALAKEVKQLTHTNYAIPVINCTAGLHLSLLALEIRSEDEILVSDYTFPASGHSVLYCGAIPRFVDVDLRTYNIDPSLIEEKITDKTRAIMVVHAFGQIADMDAIITIAKKHNLKIIEDAACALGATYKEKPAGSFGDIACFSFHGRKNATCGEGGIVVTNNEQYAKKIRSLSCFGMTSAYKRQDIFEIPTFNALGYNYKLSDINASIALAQLKKNQYIIEKKKILAGTYGRLLKDNEFIKTPYIEPVNTHTYQTYAITLEERIDRNKLMQSLSKDLIQTQIGTYASHIQPVYNSRDVCKNSLFLYNHSLALPLYYELTEKNVSLIVERLLFHIKRQLKDT